MPFDPKPFDFMLFGEAVEFLPEVIVFYRLFVGCAPAVAFPVVNPLTDAFLHVLRVGVNMNRGRALEGLECADDGGQFHAVVGRVRFAAPQLLLDVTRLQENAR